MRKPPNAIRTIYLFSSGLIDCIYGLGPWSQAQVAALRCELLVALWERNDTARQQPAEAVAGAGEPSLAGLAQQQQQELQQRLQELQQHQQELQQQSQQVLQELQVLAAGGGVPVRN